MYLLNKSGKYVFRIVCWIPAFAGMTLKSENELFTKPSTLSNSLVL